MLRAGLAGVWVVYVFWLFAFVGFVAFATVLVWNCLLPDSVGVVDCGSSL